MSNTRNKIVNENFGAWLNQASQWVSGVGKGALAGTVLAKKDDPDYNRDVQDQLYRAEILQSAILDAGNTQPMQEAFREFRGHDPDPDALFRRFDLLPIAKSQH
jgi:hypothetical protein